ncbi:MAG: 30S ribosomal protein S5 [Chloroflexota bacterium]|nr:30S ribosomal protein S5 [Chloroflexota bacterium]|tara:strand:- start:671 stop:1204 length:534 start_codon:yes stop_codon:yes gene_type:complete
MVSATNNQGGKDFRRKDSRNRRDKREESPYIEKVVSVRRVSKVVKGGRNLSFAAFVVIGDENGKIGFSSGKAAAVPDAVRKAVTSAKKDLETIKMKGTTVPHEVIAKFGASKVMIRPASQGTGIIAGGGVRAVMEVVGIKDVISKSHGSANVANVVKATVKALKSMQDINEINKERK